MRETMDAVGRRAFEIFEANGRRFGRDWDDWFQAEGEVLHPVHLRITETNGSLSVRAEVPGFTEKELQVSVEPRRLTIVGKRETAEERKSGKTIYSERCSNQIFRAADLPVEVDAASDAVKALYDQGVLTITLPKLAAGKTQKTKVEPTVVKT
jgi:HSP20 family protein